MFFDVVAIVLIVVGLFFFFGTTVGLLRFPDFYTRMHAAGKGDTLSTVLILLGLAVFHFYDVEHFSLITVLISLKILLVCGFILVASPTATHAIMNAGEKTRAEQWRREDEDSDQDSEA